MYHSFEPLVRTTDADCPLLNSHLTKLRDTYFAEGPSCSVRWGIPASVQITRLVSTMPLISLEQKKAYEAALDLLKHSRWNEASAQLRVLADAGHEEAEQLVILLLKRQNADWETYARRRAERRHTVHVVPASALEDDVIVLHRYLAHRKAPRFVLTYLIYHEYALIHHANSSSSQNDEAFFAVEKCAPHRNKAIQWLRHHGFPVFRFERASDEFHNSLTIGQAGGTTQ